MKISFITTVYSEEKSIEVFLQSILKQTKLPDEIIVVDAGSKDKTQKLIRGSFKQFNAKNVVIKLYIKKGNRAVGRNYAITKATYEHIVCSDVGCILDKNWMKNIINPFKNNNVQVVAGYYLPLVNTIFQKCLATYTCVMPDKVNHNNFLPSSRSIAFTKSAWENVGRYPEYLDTCEDLIFAKYLQQKFKIIFVRNAIAYWPQKTNFVQAFKQFYNYAKGDGQARYIRSQTPFLFIRYIVGMILFLLSFWHHQIFIFIYGLIILYIIWAVQKNYRYVKNTQAVFVLPSLQFVSDFAVLYGMIVGLFLSL